MGKALQSSLLSMVREVVFGVGFAVILPVFFHLNGVLYSMPVSDLLTFLIAVILIRNIFKTLGSKKNSK
jgi:Na+-driven multidrug efflux pump